MKFSEIFILLPLAIAGALPGISIDNPPGAIVTATPAGDICGICDDFYTHCLTTCNPANSDCIRYCYHEVCIHGPEQCHLGERCSRPECSWTSHCNGCDEFFDLCLRTCNRVTHECQEGCWKKTCVDGPAQCHWGQACHRAECEAPSMFLKRGG